MKIGLFFGSFNPVHKGHIAVASFMSRFSDLDQVWMVVSPQNPLKSKKNLANAEDRLKQVKRSVCRSRRIKVSDVEFKLPFPSYTIRTLGVLKKKFPQHKFVLVAGEDTLDNFHKWKNYKKIIEEHEIYIYPRKGAKGKLLHPNIKRFDAPRINISSTQIREKINKEIKRKSR